MERKERKGHSEKAERASERRGQKEGKKDIIFMNMKGGGIIYLSKSRNHS